MTGIFVEIKPVFSENRTLGLSQRFYAGGREGFLSKMQVVFLINPFSPMFLVQIPCMARIFSKYHVF